jgi:hypothetical protein
MRNQTDTIRDLVDVLSGPLVWLFHFGTVYAAQSVLCTLGWSDAVPWVVLLATAVALAVLGWIVIAGVSRSDRLVPHPDGENEDFMAYLEYAIAFASAISVAWVGLSAIFLPACAAAIS